jgi:hypothetical protein
MERKSLDHSDHDSVFCSIGTHEPEVLQRLEEIRIGTIGPITGWATIFGQGGSRRHQSGP